MSENDILLQDDVDGVRVLTLHRPDKKNAFNPELAMALNTALDAADSDDDVRCIVVTGTGSVFSAGADLGVFMAIGQGDLESGRPVGEVFRHVQALRKPAIAAVQGQAVGMGVTILPYFDFVYAARSASFLTPFVSLGLVLEFGSSFTLPRLIGRQRTNELILKGKVVDAATAAEWGLVNGTFDDDGFLDAVLGEARHLASLPGEALAHCKRLIREGEESLHEAACRREDAVLSQCYGSPENVAAIQAFMASRAARKS